MVFVNFKRNGCFLHFGRAKKHKLQTRFYGLQNHRISVCSNWKSVRKTGCLKEEVKAWTSTQDQ